MTSISRKAEYAVVTLIALSSLDKDETTTAKAIADSQDIPYNLVVQLLAILNKAGWTRSTRGALGGVALAKDSNKIKLQEVVELIDGPVAITRCLVDKFQCPNRSRCNLRQIWTEAQDAMLKVLAGVSIGDLL